MTRTPACRRVRTAAAATCFAPWYVGSGFSRTVRYVVSGFSRTFMTLPRAVLVWAAGCARREIDRRSCPIAHAASSA